MSNIDQDFVEFIIKSLVSNPDDVSIERTIDEKGVLLQLTVNPEDLGRVIGKRGATAQSVRTLLRALGTKNDARYNLKIVDNGEPRPRRDDNQQQAAPAQASEPAQTSSDDSNQASSEPVQPVAAAEPAPRTEPPALAVEESAPATPEESDDSFAARHRAELAELDDLDI